MLSRVLSKVEIWECLQLPLDERICWCAMLAVVSLLLEGLVGVVIESPFFGLQGLPGSLKPAQSMMTAWAWR